MDFVFGDFSDNKSERKLGQEIHSYCGGITVETRELDLLAKGEFFVDVFSSFTGFFIQCRIKNIFFATGN